jgi:hypothetical protein
MSKAKKRLLFTALLLLPIALTTIGIRLYLAKTGRWMNGHAARKWMDELSQSPD